MAPWEPERYWSAIREERARFAAELAALPPGAWSAPTLRRGWSVGGVVTHLTAGAGTGR
ncbi:maleylpyruvate isomerase N-terminal domain-containing protein, partial [Cellulomonas sp. GbtcB1]|uniref:maleylpyruvate isomerase N-terminal domain-containing protein n=1 Tax=Cellulomonas sp. GbtcB1 TaxID=2824746 RepID=UPI001C30DA63